MPPRRPAYSPSSKKMCAPADGAILWRHSDSSFGRSIIATCVAPLAVAALIGEIAGARSLLWYSGASATLAGASPWIARAAMGLDRAREASPLELQNRAVVFSDRRAGGGDLLVDRRAAARASDGAPQTRRFAKFNAQPSRGCGANRRERVAIYFPRETVRQIAGHLHERRVAESFMLEVLSILTRAQRAGE